MSLYAEYMNERFGQKAIESEAGFLLYSEHADYVLIEDFFISKEHRGKGEGRRLQSAIEEVAKEQNKPLRGMVWVNSTTCSQVLFLALADGWKVLNAQNGAIMIGKEL